MGRKAVFSSIAVGVILLLLALAWYRVEYSMDFVDAYEVNSPDLERRVLIATQGSDFKEAVVAGLIRRLGEPPTYVKVVDVSELPNVDEDQWSAIVLMHSWETWEPEPAAQAFVDRTDRLEDVVIVTTSGDGDMKMEGVEAITSASELEEIPAYVDEVKRKLDAVLERQADNR